MCQWQRNISVSNQLGVVFRAYRWATGKRKQRCQFDVMTLGGLMGQEEREWDPLSIDYHTEHRCALAGLRLCRRTKPWFSTSFPRGRALETKDAGRPLPFPPLILCFCLSLRLYLSFSASLWPVTWKQAASKGTTEQCKRPARNLKSLPPFYKKKQQKKQEFHAAAFCHVRSGPSPTSLEPEIRQKCICNVRARGGWEVETRCKAACVMRWHPVLTTS